MVTPSKRKHDDVREGEPDAEAPPTKSQQTYKKHDVHWLLDGSILLQIGKTRFKVHRSRLASESVWFQTLFDQRAGCVVETPFQYQHEIDRVLETAETVDGMDLFYLDCDFDGGADDFAALLTAMQMGIDYVFATPDLKTLGRIYGAADFFQVARYEKFAKKVLTTTFPDDWKKLRAKPSPLAANGVSMGDDFNVNVILRHSFYDLARSNFVEYPKEGDEPSGTYSDLVTLKPGQFIRLLNLQKHLMLSWDTIRSITEHLCGGEKCSKQHRCNYFKDAKAAHPFDPILGIGALLARSTLMTSTCDQAEKEVRRRLILERDLIWENMDEWLNID
ncbi:hypothetical protein GALMADRAFT_76007 [Galerina marginata CBS 339.88]|uniref:BTB domain-containing protein n=1 Tax=Galerina marginata (strain CBS 339.88) TaxID=685588 RepID=A0A067SIH2_GALM3|nr:hypothetical protein GALMADRAFT_76007 [Galerina marginata CBS 339.88]